MKIGIIGAGFTGLSAAYYLSKAGHEVVVIEKDKEAGGLAKGFKETGWNWTLEEHYHHLFPSDDSILDLAKEIGQKLIEKRPISSTLIGEDIRQLDSPLSLLKFNKLSLFGRIRVGVTLLFLKLNPFWKALENITAHDFLVFSMGDEAWKILWEPLFAGKFGEDADKVSASWFWARIQKRTANLFYPKGGFKSISDLLQEKTMGLGGKFVFGTRCQSICKVKNEFIVKTTQGLFKLDKVIVTLPFYYLPKIVRGLPSDYISHLPKIKSISSTNLILALNKKFFENGNYWLNINNTDFPFMAVVEHTNFMDQKNYAGQNILYIGNYAKGDVNPLDKTKLVNLYMPYLTIINPKFKKNWIISSRLFHSDFAQPVFPLGYSKIIPDIKTPIEGLYIANMEMVYPWDRGINYAVELGKRVADEITK